MYLLYFDHNDDPYSRKWMRKIKFFTHTMLRTISIYHYTIIYVCYDALIPIKLFDYTSIQPTFFHKRWQTYLLMLQTLDSKITNYWYKARHIREEMSDVS